MDIDKELLKKYNVHGPRYIFYPSAIQFNCNFTKQDYCWHAENSNEDPLPKPLLIYIYLPRSTCVFLSTIVFESITFAVPSFFTRQLLLCYG